MKNHYGWGGFVTQDMKRTAIVAGLSAFVANVWNIFIIYWAFRKYKLIYRLYPPLLGDQIMLPLA